MEGKEELKSGSGEVVCIARQAEETFNKKGCLWSTYFYKVVLAGNVTIIKQVVAYLETTGSMQTLDWLFQRRDFEEKRHVQKKSSKRLLLIRILIFIKLMIVSILLTPVFYALHILSVSLLNRKQRRISANIKLPLAYAAFSQTKDMVLFFLSQGVDIEHMDHQGNTVFHYISDLSSVAADTAIHIFCSMVKEIDDRDIVKKLLEQHRNSTGLTAVEYAAKFGSPALLSQILKQPNIMHHTPFAASTQQVMFHDDEEDIPSADNQDASVKTEVVDVSMYEAGKLADQSTLLNILSDRDVATMRSTDLKIFADTGFIGQWLIFKCKQMLCGVFFFHLCDVIITCLLLYLLTAAFTSQNGVTFRTWIQEEDCKIQLAEITAWSQNSSKLYKPHVFHQQLNNQILSLQQNWLASMWNEYPEEVEHFFNISSYYNFLSEQAAPGAAKEEWNVSFTALNHTHMDVLYEHARNIPRIAQNLTHMRIFQLFPQILVAFSKDLVNRKSELFRRYDGYYSNAVKIDDIYQNFTMTDGNTIVTPASAIPRRELYFLMCQSLHELNADDLADTLPSSVTFADLQNHAEDACYYQLFINKAVKTSPCKEKDKKMLVLNMFDHSNEYKMKNIYYIIELFVIVCNYLYVLLDVIERCVFLTKSVVYQTHPMDMMLTALGQKVPGSYMRKQLNVLSCLGIIFSYHLHEVIHLVYEFNSKAMFYKFENLIAMIYIIAIVVRFLMHIHALRLWPGIGHFVITTFMMGTNLLHFSAVLAIVVFIFSLLFHILIDDTDCPLEKAEGFVTLQDSLFSTFQLMFGHGNLSAFSSSAPVKVTYTLYVIIVGLLLLNLIIAIMSSTAMDIMREPWREVLWKIEWLDEATSVEYTVSVITLPFRKLLPAFGYMSHKKAGFIVKKLSNKKYGVYIECFHCPALQE